MFIAKYRLEKKPGYGGEIPARITEGGYHLSPIDGTMLGWYDTSEGEFFVDTSDSIVKMTKQNIIDRALEIHAQFPFVDRGDDIDVLTDQSPVVLIKEMNPIPQDFASDVYWPPNNI